MADLSLTSAQIVARICEDAGWLEPTDDQEEWALARANEGLRRFLRGEWHDQNLRKVRIHAWNFLRPRSQLVIFPTIAGANDGAPEYDEESETSTITAAAEAFYTGSVGLEISYTGNGNAYAIVKYVSVYQVEVAGDASGEEADADFVIHANGRYALPDDFGGLVEPFTYVHDGQGTPRIEQATARQMDELYQKSVAPGQPCRYVIEPRRVGKTVQRYDVRFWPIPAGIRTLNYRKRVLVEPLTGEEDEYPPGGPEFADAVLEAGMAASHLARNLINSAHEQAFMNIFMPAAVEVDIQLYGDKHFQRSLAEGDDYDVSADY